MLGDLDSDVAELVHGAATVHGSEALPQKICQLVRKVLQLPVLSSCYKGHQGIFGDQVELPGIMNDAAAACDGEDLPNLRITVGPSPNCTGRWVAAISGRDDVVCQTCDQDLE